MGAFLDKPKVEKHNEGGRGNGVRYGLSSMQGWRVEMEDAHCAVIGLPYGLDEWSFFAVFDGHAGDSVSAYCSSELIRCIIQNPDFLGSENQNSICANPSPDNVHQGIRTGFLNLDDKLRNMPNVLNGKDKSGSTATSVCITPDHLFFANCGDSRATLTRAGRVFYSTQDHKPMNPAEKERIQNAGGSVMIQRVNGSLAVSRALGDFEYKNVKDKGPCEQLVSPEPEICAMERSLDDEFIVLACDGVWDVMTNEELSEFVTSRLKITDNLEEICNQVVDTCLHKGSRDNMSIVIVCFDGAPKVSSEAIRAEEELNARIEAKVKEILEDAEVSPRGVPTTETDVRCVMTALSGQEISGLPPGGGLMSKYPLVESLVSRLGIKHTQDQPVVSDDI